MKLVLETEGEGTTSFKRSIVAGRGEDAFTYKLQLEGFADTVLHGTPQHGANIDDGIAAMRAMVAISRSAETGEAVRLADVSGGV